MIDKSDPRELSPLIKTKDDLNSIEVNPDLLPSKYMTAKKSSSQKEIKVKKLRPSDFEIKEMIGAGNFAQVFKAFNKRHEKLSALKILVKDNAIKMKQIDHIINERNILKFLTDHNNS